MRSIKDIIEDLATPGGTMGTGNPMPPGINGEVGSGDIFIGGKRRRKRTGEVKEGILDIDIDLGMTDTDAVILGCKERFTTLMTYYRDNTTMTESEYQEFIQEWKEELNMIKVKPSSSVMAAFRSKEYTIISFKKSRNNIRYTDQVEIRRFIKNPTPEAIGISRYNDGTIGMWHRTRLTHPSPVEIRNSDIYFLPGSLYDSIYSLFIK